MAEFEYAKNGMIGLESLFGVVWSMVNGESSMVNGEGSMVNSQWAIGKMVEKLAVAPRRIFGLPVPVIEENSAAKLTLFNPDTTYVFEESMIRSKSKNSAFIGKQLKGKVIGIINGDKMYLN